MGCTPVLRGAIVAILVHNSISSAVVAAPGQPSALRVRSPTWARARLPGDSNVALTEERASGPITSEEQIPLTPFGSVANETVLEKMRLAMEAEKGKMVTDQEVMGFGPVNDGGATFAVNLRSE